MRYFTDYFALCAYCRNSGADKSKRRKSLVWTGTSWESVWALPI